VRVKSADNQQKCIHATSHSGDDDDEDGLPLLYPFDADQVPFFTSWLSQTYSNICTGLQNISLSLGCAIFYFTFYNANTIC